MLDLKLREEFRGKRLKGTTVDFKTRSGTGPLGVTAGDFLTITYPSHDLLKTIEATGPGQSRPVVLLGSWHGWRSRHDTMRNTPCSARSPTTQVQESRSQACSLSVVRAGRATGILF